MSLNKPKTIFIFAGEHSGDLHGSHLLKNLISHLPDYSFTGVAGPRIREQGIKHILRVEDFEVMGFTDVLKSFPKLYKQFYIVRDYILDQNPQAVILIDYPGFNLRLAKALRKKGYKGKIIQYISPSVWAWGNKRVKFMAEHLDLLLTIYPFEEKFFAETNLKVKYVGNPLQDYIPKHPYQLNWMHDLGLPKSIPIIALFPGSREGEIKRNLPLQLQAAFMLKKMRPDRCFAISCANQKCSHHIENIIEQSSLKLNQDVFLVPKNYTYELMRDSRTAIAKSGTVTLELALHQRPTVVIYHLTPLNRFIAKRIMGLNLPHYCIVNILGGKSVFPELIEYGLTPSNLLAQLNSLDNEGNDRDRCLLECQNIANMLHVNNASMQAATSIAGIL
jgi:lipid-A-disaccharide synthase